MNVDVAVRGQLQHPWRDDPSVTYNDDGIGRNLRQLFLEFFILPDLVRLHNRQAQLHRRLLHRRSSQFHPPALRTVRLRHNQPHVVSGSNYFFERWHCELRRAAEYQLHAHSPARCSFLILRRIMSRLRPLTWVMNSLPLRWSVSCRKARASSPSPVLSNHLPVRSWARTVTTLARVTSSRKSGRLRQPSLLLWRPSVLMISGLTSTILASGSSLNVMSMTTMRLPIPICGAASPTP